MTFKKQKIFVATFAIILSLAIISSVELPFAAAENNESNDKKTKFSKKLLFKTADCRLADPAQKTNVESQLGIIINPDGTLPSQVDCKAKAWFNTKATALKYKIQITGMDLIDEDGNALNDVGKSHFHTASSFVEGNPDNPMGPMHILNIFGQPGMDDGDLVVKPVQGILRGIWDDSDAKNRIGDNDDTLKITDKFVQESLCQGEGFLMVHGKVPDGNGGFSKPGFIKASLQLTNAGEKFCEKKLNLSTESDL